MLLMDESFMQRLLIPYLHVFSCYKLYNQDLFRVHNKECMIKPYESMWLYHLSSLRFSTSFHGIPIVSITVQTANQLLQVPRQL